MAIPHIVSVDTRCHAEYTENQSSKSSVHSSAKELDSFADISTDNICYTSCKRVEADVEFSDTRNESPNYNLLPL
jgi:hypothetical protein